MAKQLINTYRYPVKPLFSINLVELIDLLSIYRYICIRINKTILDKNGIRFN